MAYQYPFKPWFQLTTSEAPKCLFWPLLIGSLLFWFVMSVIRSIGKTIVDCVESLEEHRQDCCCTLRFIFTAPFLAAVLCVIWPIGIIMHLWRDTKNLWEDTKLTVQWHKEQPGGGGVH